MGKPQFTKMQQAAIDIRNRNILVSAAAGSGKTAVLVQRIIDRILSEDSPIDIDRILVMTFTKAAAQQMKERILNAINEKRSENPYDQNLSKQYALVHNAYIMTIDSFCMSVVRNHYEEIDLSPDFRMADEAETKLIRQDVLSEVLEERYESGKDEFLEMTEVFATSKTDEAIEKLVLSLYDYAISHPDPLKWLDGCMSEYSEHDDADGESIKDRDNIKEPYKSAFRGWTDDYVNQTLRELSTYRRILDEAADLCNAEFGPLPYLSTLEEDIALLDSILAANDYASLHNLCLTADEAGFKRIASVRLPKEGTVPQDEINERTRLRDRVRSLRDACKDGASKNIKLIAEISPEDIEQGMRMMKGPVSELVELTKAFIERFDKKKREENIVDFDDLEHMCLNILRKGEDTTAAEYRDFFEEIYVDEYQDSNFVQEEILGLIAKRDDDLGNLFMVGDVKQSIYGFRNAKPEIFVDKYNRYSSCDENVCVSKDGEDTGYTLNTDISIPRDVRVDLSHNFRSRLEVLESVNNIFKKIMKKELGGIVYDDAAALHLGRNSLDTGSNNATELNLFIADKEVPDKEAEALMVANRIKELMKTMTVEDSDVEGGIRPLKYSDIVILLRSTKGWDNIFMDVISSQGIPVFVASSTGYFEAMEVVTLLNFLKIIDNPLQDIPLAAVMMSVIGGFFEEEIAQIRGEFKNGYLYDALLQYMEIHCVSGDDTGEDSDKSKDRSLLSEKVYSFVSLLNYYRKKSEYSTVSEILVEIIDGDYGKIIKAMPGGAKRSANLNMLLKKSMEYGKTSYKGIFQFNRYIEAIRKYEVDYGEANISDENDDTVRIMSVHKSKGLEFPVCFLCGMQKGFNMMDTHATVLTDSKYGIATDIVDVKRRVKAKSLFKEAVARKKHHEIIAEELRLLYVAMTRAKDKLIMSGVVKDENVIGDSIVTIDKAGSYLDMYICAMSEGGVPGVELSYKKTGDLINEVVEESVTEEVNRNRLLAIIDGKLDSDEITETDAKSIVKERLEFKYPYEDKGNVKLSVSELKKRSESQIDDGDKDNADVTAHLYEGNNNAALHGTAVHRIFEIWDYNQDTEISDVEAFLSYVHEEMLIEDDLFETIKTSEIYDFVNSDIAKRMKKAFQSGELYREQPFVISDDPSDPESMLVQGIIDAYFIEDGKIVLVDYKTDRNTTAEKLKEKHGVQLKYYGMALSRMLHLELKESIIYSTFLKKSISIL